MQTEKDRKAGPQRKIRTKTTRILKWVLAAAVVLILLVVFLLPSLVSSEKGREIILAKINDSVDGEVDFATLSVGWFKGLKVTDFSFEDDTGRTAVRIKQIATRPHYGSVLMGRLSFGETIIDDIQISGRMTSKLLKYVNPVFANAFNVTGVADFSCEHLAIPLAPLLGGSWLTGASRDDIEVTGTVSMKKLRLQTSDLLGQILSLLAQSCRGAWLGGGVRGQEITIHPTRFVLRNGLLRYEDMQMDIGDNPVVFGGTIGLDGSLNMTVTLPYSISGRTARAGRETEGQRITLPIRGTLDEPELDVGELAKQLLGEQLKEKLKQKAGRELGEQAEKILDELFK